MMIIAMNGPEFKAWREGFDLTQADVATHFDVSRTTIQNWEALAGPLPPAVDYGLELWSRSLRQRQPLRGPVTLNYSDGPMFIRPYGPRRPMAMLQQEAHASNAAVLARVAMLASSDGMFNPFVLEEGDHDLWNIVELQRVVDGKDPTAPTLPNMLRRLAAGIRADAPNFVRSGPLMWTQQEINQRVDDLGVFAQELERIARMSVPEIVRERRSVDANMAGIRQLGIRPKDELVTAIAQALVAAAMPIG
ncbi:MAG TPA: hypothetical protein VFI23_14730 [Rhizomicrobium sp.]|nr:hypothetical protein [Rhizomicrobium sp.]